jgi:hypothetical protein
VEVLNDIRGSCLGAASGENALDGSELCPVDAVIDGDDELPCEVVGGGALGGSELCPVNGVIDGDDELPCDVVGAVCSAERETEIQKTHPQAVYSWTIHVWTIV